MLKLAIRGAPSQHITLEANPADARQAVHGLMDTVFGIDDSIGLSRRMPFSMVKIVKAGMMVKYQPEDNHTPRAKNFTVSYPNSCTLKHEGKDAVLRQILIDSGIGPQVTKEEVVF